MGTCVQPLSLAASKRPWAGDDLFVLIDQNGRIEAERFDAPSDGSNLSPIMLTRIARIGLQIGGREKRELTRQRWRFAVMSPLLLEPIFRLEMRIA